MIGRSGRAGILLAVVLAYLVLLGGTALGETNTLIRLVNATIAAAFIVRFILRSPGRSDGLDRAMVAALLLFSLASVSSGFPRQSLDAVLGVLTWVAVLWVAREELTDRRTRRLTLAAFVALSAILTLLATGRWLVPVIDWWRAVGGQAVPPLNFEFGGFPWGHRHDLTLAIVMLYPAWWIGRPSLLRRAGAIGIGMLTVGIILVDGSRALWLAIALASGVVAVPSFLRLWRRLGVSWHWAAAITVLGAGVLLVSGLGTALVERATSVATLEYRAAMWGAIARDWLTHPLQGNGPGSFPWVLQLTGYFDTNSWAPRHPDSAVAQGVAEGGLLVLAAMAVVVLAIGAKLVNSSSRAAKWALLTFAIASVNASPTDFAFVVALAVAWVAYGVPRADAEGVRLRSRWPARQWATVVCLLVISVAYGATLVAASAYDRARVAIAAQDMHEARAALSTALFFDPSMALYARTRGTAAYVAGDLRAAARDLARAATLNPADDLIMRTLALVRFKGGDQPGGDEALRRAVSIQRSDSTNLFLTARHVPDLALETLAEIVQAWPAVVFATGWDDALPSGVTTKSVVNAALEGWRTGEPVPELERDQGIWLAVMGERPDLIAEAIERSGHAPGIGRTLSTAITCGETRRLLDELPPSIVTESWYWWIQARADILDGGTGEEPMRVARLMGRGMAPDGASGYFNPLNENTYLVSTDVWGYRRDPVKWPGVEPLIPAHPAGEIRWLFEPSNAAHEANLGYVLASCLGE